MRVLVASHRPEFCSALELYLRNKADVEVVATVTDYQTMLTRAQATSPEIILLDWHFTHRSQETVIQTLKQFDFEPAVILINVGPGDHELAMAAGADDVVLNDDSAKSIMIAIETIRLKRTE